MKLFICSIVTLILMFALVFAENAYVTELFDYISSSADTALDLTIPSNDRKELLVKVEKELDKRLFMLSFAIGHDDITAVMDYIEDAKRQADGDEGQYLAALDKLKREVDRLRTSETLCLDGII
ncbi:MAG: DUF4363 family protein [Clostridia bacterium]|nr:DUF4363 family protein [Clostridia bacterium]